MSVIRHVAAIVLLLVKGLWRIIGTVCSYKSLEERFQILSQQVITKLFAWTPEEDE